MYFDGASRGNPGIASFGGVIYDENKDFKICSISILYSSIIKLKLDSTG